MKTEKIFKIVDEEWRLSLQSFTHSPDMNLRCRFYMTRNHSFKSVELMVWKRPNIARKKFYCYQNNKLLYLDTMENLVRLINIPESTIWKRLNTGKPHKSYIFTRSPII